MIQKRLLRPDRLRQVPPSFNWVDHRLVRDHHLDRCDCTSLALYLFMVTVCDVQGLSYYSDASVCRRLKIDALQFSVARSQLEKADLIAFHKPLYQVVSGGAKAVEKRRFENPFSLCRVSAKEGTGSGGGDC